MFDLEHLGTVFSPFDLERNCFMISRLNFTISNTCISCHSHVILNGVTLYVVLDAVKFNLDHEIVSLHLT
jgi:hypothetical protein